MYAVTGQGIRGTLWEVERLRSVRGRKERVLREIEQRNEIKDEEV